MAKEPRDVGYGQPPREHRFKKGVSGNPKGRPKGSTNKPPSDIDQLTKLIIQEGNRTIQIKDGNGSAKMSTMQAMLRSMLLKAIKGDTRAASLMFGLYADSNQAATSLRDDNLRHAMAFLEHQKQSLERARSEGGHYRIPRPHPDMISINHDNGEVFASGPKTEADYAFFEYGVYMILNLETGLLHASLAMSKDEFLKSESVQFEQELLSVWRKSIKQDDVLFLELKQRYANALIDSYFYYGERPSGPDQPILGNGPIVQPTYSSLEARRGSEAYSKRMEEFRQYMRAHVEIEMDDRWGTRFAPENLIARDVEHDKIRWEYHTGQFKLSDYEDDSLYGGIFNDNAKLKAFMAWY